MSVYTTSTSGIFIGWETSSNLGTLNPGKNSELFVKLAVSTSSVTVKYYLDGELPTGLNLNHDGTISGIVPVNTSTNNIISTSTFFVTAKDNNYNHLTTGTFSITVSQTSSIEYTSIYFKPLQTKVKRLNHIKFIQDEEIFVQDLIYRPYDSNFGIQRDLKLVLDFGVKKLSLEEYADIISQNFQKRRFFLGSLKSAVARNADKSIRYSLIYVDVIDKNVINGISVAKSFIYNGVTYYPSSIPNIRDRINDTTVRTDELDPLFTKETQVSGYGKLGYIPFIPVCFTTEIGASKIIRNIKSRFNDN